MQVGVELSPRPKQAELIRQLVERDIMRFIPEAVRSNSAVLLQQALDKTLPLLTPVLLSSPDRALRHSIAEIFHRAVKLNQIPHVNLLLATKDKTILNSVVGGGTALLAAVSSGNHPMVKLLLHNGANIDVQHFCKQQPRVGKLVLFA